MRERTTWNRKAIAKFAAALSKKAEDPRAMNQDHLSQQPAADKYVIGGPSDFAEDVHPSSGTWKAEYSGDEVKRDEIGMPEMRKDTFNHPEKTAADQEDSEEESEEFLEKKADVCLNIARKMLPKTASESIIEDQAVALMHLPNVALIETATRMAADEDDAEEGQDKQAQQQSENPFAKKDEDDKKQAGEVPPQFLEHMKKKDDDKGQDDKAQDKQAQQQSENPFAKKDEEDKAQDKQAQDQDQGQGQDKQANIQMLSQQMVQAFQSGNMQLAQESIQQMVQQAMQQQAPVAPQAAPQDAPQLASDDQLLDQMLQQDQGQPVLATSAFDGFDLQSTAMDVGEVKLASDEDEALRALFASHSEVQAAVSANASQGGVRTASTRTVGTRPSGGVSQLGGGVSEPSSGGDIEKLSSLWQSAPDVKNAF